jgi:hypothetical protein
MDIFAANLKIFPITDAVVGKAALPYRYLRAKPMREAALDVSDRSLNRDAVWRQKEMDKAPFPIKDRIQMSYRI